MVEEVEIRAGEKEEERENGETQEEGERKRGRRGR